MKHQARRRKRWPRGTWMKLRSKEILIAFMETKDFSNGRLAQYSDCSRAFISHLKAGRKTSCTTALAERIAEALDIPVEALFEPKVSAGSGQNVRTLKAPAA